MFSWRSDFDSNNKPFPGFFCTYVTKRVSMQSLSYENEPIDGTHFHMNGFIDSF